MSNPVYLSDVVAVTQAPAQEKAPGTISAQYTSADIPLGALTFTGTPPSGTITKTYFWTMSGRIVTLEWRIRASTSGLLVTSVSTPLPSDVPLPRVFADQGNDEWVKMGSGALLSNSSDGNAAGATCGIYKDSSGVFQLKINSGSITVGAKFAKGLVTYISAG